MKFGYWSPVWGSWLRNVDDDPTPCSWEYVRDLAVSLENKGYELTLVPELNLNDIKGHEAPVLDAWTVATGLAVATQKLEILAALRPQYHQLAPTAKRIATIQEMAKGRFSINLVSAWWQEEARQYGINFAHHDDRYGYEEEYITAMRGLWRETPFTHHGKYFNYEDSFLSPKPLREPTVYAGGESEVGRETIARFADSYLMHGHTIDELKVKIADMKARKERLGLDPFRVFGMAVYIIIRDSEKEARKEYERITTIQNYERWENSHKNFTGNSTLDVEVARVDYSVTNRGLRSNLVGTPEQVAERLLEYQDAGLGVVLVQSAPVREELERIAEQVIPLVNKG
ncbi:MAG: LLM class flavin-dependent oxidoreductase [Neisseriaceae bacterium]|nr:LLM class flavin-dependent oxidoreductase [Neisseriaceae bacterium]